MLRNHTQKYCLQKAIKRCFGLSDSQSKVLGIRTTGWLKQMLPTTTSEVILESSQLHPAELKFMIFPSSREVFFLRQLHPAIISHSTFHSLLCGTLKGIKISKQSCRTSRCCKDLFRIRCQI